MKNTETTRRNLFKVALATTALIISMPVMAAGFPDRAVTLVVPFAPGGNTDLTARIYAEALSAEIGQPVVVDNRPGAGGTTGGGIVANADADGYTLLWSGSSLLSIAPLLYSNLPFDISEAFQPISRIMEHSIVLAVNPNVPVDTIEEFVAYAQDNPGAVNYGSPGVGTIHHLTMELFKADAGFDALHIPYQGNGPAMIDLLSGTIQAMFMGVPLALPYDGAGNLKFLGVTSADPDPNMPDLRSFTDAGYPSLQVAQSWYGVLAPAGLPEDVLEALSEASKIAAQSENVIRVAAEQGMTTVVENPEDFASAISTEARTWADVVETAGIVFE